MATLGSPARRLLIVAGLLTAALVACGRELVAPTSTPVNAFHRTGSLAIDPQYESTLPPRALRAALIGVAFDRVRITLRRDDGSIALDTVVLFPAGSDSLALTLNVPLPASAPSTGVPLNLNLGYVNAAGDTVFRGGPVPITVVPTVSGGTPTPTTPVQIPVHYTGTGATATAVVISPKSFAGTPGQSVTFTGRALDSGGNPISGTPVVFTASNPAVVSVNEATGVATLVGRGTGKVYALLLTGQADSAVVSVSLPASQLTLTGGAGQTAPAGTTLPTAITARVLASDGVGVAGATVTFAAANGGTATPSSAVSDASGNVSTAWKLGSTPGAQTLTIASAGLSGSPITVNATAQAVTPTRLAVLTQPAGGTAGVTLSAVTVAAQDAAGNTMATYTGDVSVTLGANPGGATLSGTTTVKAVAGVASFGDLKLNRPGTGYTFVFGASGLTSATSSAFNITAGSAARLVFGTMPATVDAGVVISPAVTVTAQDSVGNTVSSFTGAVTVAIGANPGGATLAGTLTKNAVLGVATFDNLAIAKAATGYTLTAAATGMTGATSAAFNVAPGLPTALAVVSGSGQTAQASTALSPIIVQVRDALGNGISGITVNFAVTSGGGSLSSASGVTDASGQTSVVWTLGPINGAQTMTAAASGLSTATITATATGGSTNQLVISAPPSPTQTAGVTFSPSVVVQAKDALGVVQTGFTGAVTATVATGPAGATVGGTTSVNAVAGVATFSALRLTKAGAYTLQFAASGYASATTTTITVNPAPAKAIAADSGNAQTGAGGAALPIKLVALVTDSLGNPVSAAPVTWTVGANSGSLASTTTATDANGRVRATWTLGVLPGVDTVRAASAGLIGSPVTFLATAQGVITSTLVSPHLDTIVSLNATFQLSAQAKDGAGSNMTGTFTWVSRTPSVASVNTTGLVTALANGTTWVVATESGGTKDSALIVVQQRVATINVTPGTRNIYKSRTFKFAASAVDGMGNVMPGITSFTWSTLAPSTATVDTGGTVTALQLGSTQVRATSGAITGVAAVTVLTPITRIVVGRDSSGVPVNDTTALPSLGVGRWFAAQARDTLDNVMTGVTFTWTSTNPTVALLDTIQAARARALSNANGITTIQAVADGITGSAPLKVQQVLAAIELTPTPSTIGVAGTVQLTARGKDANARYISGGSFTFASSVPGVATVNATSGVVTGVAIGTTNVTATSGAVTSNAAVVDVSSVVPPIISFGRDTLTVGRGSSTSIPILLSRPNATNVTVNVSARDTVAYFSSASVTIPAGSTSANVTLNGRNAGTTLIYATDGSGTGYTGDTAAVAVQANVRFASTYWYLNSGDQVATQVLLSDPSPAGGTYITYSYGTTGKAQVSPDPAFIPTGQLASNVVITALGTTSGNTTITPQATGVNGTASTMYVSAPVLTISAGASAFLGSGQYESGWYVYVPQYTNVAIPLTFTSTDTSKVTVAPASGSIPVNSYYQYFTVSGKTPGTAKVIVSSPGWTPDTLSITVTSPRTTLCCGYTINTTSPIQSFTVYVRDSIGNTHYRTSSLALTISSSDTTVVKIIDQTPVVSAGSYYASGIRFQPGGAGGTAYIKVVAGGHAPDSMLVTVVGPKLQFSWCCTNSLGKGQYDQPYVYTPDYLTSPLTVTIASSDTNKVSTATTVTIPTGSYYAYFNVMGKDTGSVTLFASAPGYQPDTAYYKVNTPRVGMNYCCNYTLNNFGGGFNVSVYARDSLGSAHNRITPLAVSIVSRDTNIVKLDSASVTIAAGQYYSSGYTHLTPMGVGTTWVVVTAPGHSPDSSQYTVQTPKLSFNFYSTVLGRRQMMDPNGNGFYVSTPDYRPSPLAVTLTQKNAAADSLSTTALTIPTSSYYAYANASGLAIGTDTIIATAPGYLPDTAFIRVGPTQFTQCCMPGSAQTTSPQNSITVYATDSLGSGHYVLDTVTVLVTSSDTTVIRPAQKYVHIPRGQYYTNAYYNYFGPGTASLTFTDSAGVYAPVTTGSVTVTGPSLVFNSSSFTVGMRQTSGSTGFYVYTQNNVASAVTVNLVSTDTRVATVPASVTIPAGSNYAYFGVTAMDTVGTIQIQATATGFGPATPMTVQVTQPKFSISASSTLNTTSSPSYITVYATDANGNTHYTTENVTVTLASSSGAVATVDSATVTIPAGAYYNSNAHWSPVAAGTTQLSASDGRAALYKYNTATYNVTVNVPTLYLSWSTLSLGLGQYTDSYYTSTPDNMPSGATVSLTHNGAAKATLPATVSIPAGSNYVYFRMTGAARGADTVTASLASPLHNPRQAVVVVDSGRIDSFGGWPGASMHVGDSVLVTLYTRDPANYYYMYNLAATTFNISSSTFFEIHQSNAVVTSVTVPADAYQVQFWVKAKATGSGSVTFTNANYQTYTPPNVTVIP